MKHDKIARKYPQDHYRFPEDHLLIDIEIDAMADAIYRYHGFDFRHYARESMRRRIFNLLEIEGLPTISSLQNKILHDMEHMERFLLAMSINVTSMFRDPDMFYFFRETVIPILRTYPSIRIWHAGCASGEEVYSLAILLEEEHLAEKAKIYATDINEVAIKKASQGIYPNNSTQEFTDNYLAAGGKKIFSQYYQASYDSVIFKSYLRDKVVFARHNLVSDASFNEFNVIFCRNVLIYFNEELQQKVHRLLLNSLCRFGILVLGSSETVEYSEISNHYKVLDSKNGIFQRVV